MKKINLIFYNILMSLLLFITTFFLSAPQATINKATLNYCYDNNVQYLLIEGDNKLIELFSRIGPHETDLYELTDAQIKSLNSFNAQSADIYLKYHDDAFDFEGDFNASLVEADNERCSFFESRFTFDS